MYDELPSMCKRPADYVLARHCILTAVGIYQVRFRRYIDGKKNRCEPGRGGEVGEARGAARALGLSVAEFCRRERVHPVTFYGLSPTTGRWVEARKPVRRRAGLSCQSSL